MEEIPRPGSADTYMDTSSAQITSSGETAAVDLSKPLVSNQTTDEQSLVAEDLSAQKPADIAVETPMECDTASINPVAESQVDPTRISNPAEEGASLSAEVKAGELNSGGGGADSDVKGGETPISVTASVTETAILAPASTVATSAADIEMSDATLPRPDIKAEAPDTKVTTIASATMQTTIPPATTPAAAKPKSLFASLFPPTPKPPTPPVQPVNVSTASLPTATTSTPEKTPSPATPAYPTPVVAHVKEAVQMPAEPGNAPDIKPIQNAKPVSPAVATDATPIASVSVSASAEAPVSTVAAFPVSSSGVTSSESVPPKNADKPLITEAAPPVVVPVVSSKMDTSTAGAPAPVVVKLEVKQPPPGGKTMKRESRKGSTASPTGLTGEAKKKSKAGSPGGKTKKKQLPPKEDGHDGRNDFYCWICHKEGEVLCCELCPRVFHAKCLHMTVEPEGDWFCPECEKITDAECKETQSRAMSMLTIDQFSLLLKYVIQRMKLPMSEAFHDPVDTKMFPDYPDYVFHPMDLSTIEKNIKKRKYGCPEAFVAEFKWVVHNCVIYNSPQSKLTQTAKAMLKVAERELGEIEVCPECYLNSCRKRENWFCEPCKELHPLVWAKLQGFPHWPAKALRIEKGQVDVRFFGQHDRAWIPISGCYLISKELPLPVKNKKKGKGPGMRGGLDNAMLEMQGYIENIKRITGEFEYAPPRTGLTHCDLYRRSGTLSKGPGGKQPEANKPKSDMVSEGKGSAKMDAGNDKAKIELKDIASGKDLAKQQILTSLTPKKAKLVTTSGEHPARPFATKKKKAAMESLKKTIESCKASLGIENLQDVKMNSGSEETSSSSSDEENEGEENKEETQGAVDKEQKDVPSTSGLSAKPATEEDDSDAELVIDLGDMDESADTTETKQADKADTGGAKTDETAAKKRKTEASEGPSVGKPLKSILVTAPKLSERDERKKMLAKALSEKIATGKRKHDVDGTPSGTSPSTKIRKTQDPHEKLGIMKEKKKHHGKDISGKPKGILKPSDAGILRKEGHGGSEKRPSDLLKHKHKDGRDLQKNPSKKQPMPPDKPGRKDKMTIPTGADARKLFNGGRIPRKNPITSDEEPGEKEPEDQIVDQTPDVVTRRRSSERVQPPRTASSINGINRRTSLDGPKRTEEENITFASLKKYSDKVMDSVQKVFYEMYTDMMVPLRANASPEKQDTNTASAMHQVAQMRLELERLKWMHEQEIAELKHNHDLTVAEIRQSLENEKKQLLLDARLQAETEKNRAVDEAKRKQWCAYCNKEAIFYCCWNTSYCDYPCQQRHWAQHVKSCAQAKASGGASATPAITESKTPAPAKPLSLPSSTSSIGKTTLTLSGVGSLSKPATSTKSMVVLPSSLIISKQTPASVAKGVAKIPTTSSEKVLKVSIPAPAESAEPKAAGPQKSGISISAISARLLAAKQKTTPTESAPGKVEAAKTDTSTPPASAAISSDHVKTTLDSPLSPDAKPSSPTKDVSPLVISTKAVSNVDKPKDTSSVPKQSHKPSEAAIMKIKVEKDTAVTTESKTTATKCEDTALSSTVQATTASLKTTVSKRPLTSNILGFSSPSVVASMITDMDTPLSSSLSSEESSSCQETPEKKEDNPAKVQLSAAGSAFTKVIPDATKHPPTENKEQAEKSQKALSFSAKPAPTPPTDSTTSFKPIETKASEDVAADKEGDTHPVVAPVLADSYLSTLQHKLAEKGAKKTPTPPAGETSAEKESQRPVNTELYRPVFYGAVESKKEKEHKLDETMSPT